MTAIIAEEQPVAPEEIAEKTDVSRRKLGATIQKLVDVMPLKFFRPVRCGCPKTQI